MKKQILFVDDDPQLLAGLRNLLHRDRERWEMTFVIGGQAALDELCARSFHCVVTDLKMPVVDGTVVIETVRRDHPAARCVMLSGSDCEVVAGAVDELLVKPCSARTLRTTLERLLK